VEEFDWTDVPPDRRPEVRRRIEILDQFLSLEKPSPEDRLQAREDLGVSRPMFYLLLNAWKQSRRPADLPGARAWKSGPRRKADASGAADAACADFPLPQPLDQLDLSHVPPERREEVRRRIEIIDRYLAIQRATPEDRARAIAQLGLGKTMFRMIVTAWRRTRDPAQVAGAQRSSRAGAGRHLRPEVDGIIEEVLSHLGPSSPDKLIFAEVARRCSAAALPAPSKDTVQHRRLQALVAGRSVEPPDHSH
jgi:hypothetical protein